MLFFQLTFSCTEKSTWLNDISHADFTFNPGA